MRVQTSHWRVVTPHGYRPTPDSEQTPWRRQPVPSLLLPAAATDLTAKKKPDYNLKKNGESTQKQPTVLKTQETLELHAKLPETQPHARCPTVRWYQVRSDVKTGAPRIFFAVVKLS